MQHTGGFRCLGSCCLCTGWVDGCPLPTEQNLSPCPQFGMQWNVTWGRINRLSELEVSHTGGLQGPGRPVHFSLPSRIKCSQGVASVAVSARTVLSTEICTATHSVSQLLCWLQLTMPPGCRWAPRACCHSKAMARQERQLPIFRCLSAQISPCAVCTQASPHMLGFGSKAAA